MIVFIATKNGIIKQKIRGLQEMLIFEMGEVEVIENTSHFFCCLALVKSGGDRKTNSTKKMRGHENVRKSKVCT